MKATAICIRIPEIMIIEGALSFSQKEVNGSDAVYHVFIFAIDHQHCNI